MESFLHDLRYGIRLFLKKPSFTIVALLVLAIGIGSSTAIFSVVNGILVRPLPYKDSEQLAILWTKEPDDPVGKNTTSFADLSDWRSQNSVFESIEAFAWTNLNIVGAGEPERVPAMRTTSGFLQFMGANPSVGRLFSPDEDAEGSRVVILSHSYRVLRFGADSNPLGSTIPLNGENHTIIGIVPEGFAESFADWADAPDRPPALFVPLTITPARKANRGARNLYPVGRLKPGVMLTQAQADMSIITDRLSQQYPETNENVGISVVSLREELLGDIRPTLLVLLGAVGFVLLISCTNVATLLLSRAVARQKEIAIRLAVGAGRPRLIRQMLTESVLLSTVGGMLGLLLAYLGLRLLLAVSPADIPRLNEIAIDGRVLIFTFVVIATTGILFGMMPAFQASRIDLVNNLKEGTERSGGISFLGRMRSLLVVVEVSVAVLLLVGAMLMIRSFIKLQNVEMGIEPQNVLTMRILLPAAKYSEDHRIAAFHDQLLSRVENLPGVESAGIVLSLPFGAGNTKVFFVIDGRQPPSQQGWPPVDMNVVSADYFKTIGMPLRAGRVFNEQDGQNTPKAVILNESMANSFWPGEDPVGRQFTLDMPGGSINGITIVGVVSDVRQRGLDEEVQPSIFMLYTQLPDWAQAMYLVARTKSDPAELIGQIRGAIWAIDPDQPVAAIAPMEQIVSKSVAGRRFNMILLEVFAAIALLTAMAGIYGLISYLVTQRTREIGIRMALGARAGDVLKLFLKQGLVLTLIGIAVGLFLATRATSLMKSMLFEVSTLDTAAFLITGAAFVIAAVLAVVIPARRALLVDPVSTLKNE